MQIFVLAGEIHTYIHIYGDDLKYEDDIKYDEDLKLKDDFK